MKKILRGIEKEKIFKFLVCFITITIGLTFTAYCANGEVNMEKVNSVGNKILGIVTSIAFWVILVKGVSEIIRHCMSGDLHEAGKCLIVYVLMYAALFIMPVLMHLVEGIF